MGQAWPGVTAAACLHRRALQARSGSSGGDLSAAELQKQLAEVRAWRPPCLHLVATCPLACACCRPKLGFAATFSYSELAAQVERGAQ